MQEICWCKNIAVHRQQHFTLKCNKYTNIYNYFGVSVPNWQSIAYIITPSIMFGNAIHPQRCGSTSSLHVLYQRQHRVLHHSNLVLGDHYNISQISANSSKAHFDTCTSFMLWALSSSAFDYSYVPCSTNLTLHILIQIESMQIKQFEWACVQLDSPRTGNWISYVRLASFPG